MDYKSASNQQLEELVAKKDGEAICELGERCLYGTNGTPKNLTRAYQLFHKGEKMGLSKAYVGLAKMYENGWLFAKNENLAREYYKKGNVPGQGPEQEIFVNKQDTILTAEMIQSNPSSVITEQQFVSRLDDAEKSRAGGDYENAKKICREIFRDVTNVQSKTLDYQGNIDVDEFEIQANWIMAYTSYNEQNYQDMEKYFLQDNVSALHPWGWYLFTASHKIMQQADIVIEQDLQTLIMTCQNRNLSQSQRGDFNVMIADLIMEGYGKSTGMDEEAAKNYYLEAINCGNEYAKEQYAAYGF